MVISAKGKDFKKAVSTLFYNLGPVPVFTEDVEVTVTLFPPDVRRRDIDNFAGKALWDSIEGLAYENDSQIKCYRNIEWGPVDKVNKGRIEITIKEYSGQTTKRTLGSDPCGGGPEADASGPANKGATRKRVAKPEVPEDRRSPFRVWTE